MKIDTPLKSNMNEGVNGCARVFPPKILLNVVHTRSQRISDFQNERTGLGVFPPKISLNPYGTWYTIPRSMQYHTDCDGVPTVTFALTEIPLQDTFIPLLLQICSVFTILKAHPYVWRDRCKCMQQEYQYSYCSTCTV